jgi:O-antigen ligase/polysaccharide polymerase Wzy-like membrane protein
MTDAARAAGACALLAAPTVLAFFTGGFRDDARLAAGVGAWLLVVLAAVFAERALPRSTPARAALGGAALLAAWTTLSIAWSPVSSAALDDAQRVILYLGVLVAAVAFLVPGRPARAVEPALAAGALLVICYGLSERLVPGLVELDRSVSAAARLEQPLTYWNAMGLVAAIGLMLVARLAGDRTRPLWMRCGAAAASSPLGAAVYLTFSRGALVALMAGLAVLALLLPRRGQLLAIGVVLGAGILSAVSVGVFPWVRGLEESGSRSEQGIAALVLLTAIAAGAALLARRLAATGPARDADSATPRHTVLALAAVAVVVVGIAVAATNEARPDLRRPATGATPSRLVSVDSNRYQYWRVAIDVFGEHPLVGDGAGAFRVEWLRRRSVDESVVDAHSIVIETAAELGLVGLVALALLLGGTAVAARRAYRIAPEAAAGPTAVVAAWMTHSLLDWDWEMPAVTLIALVCAGALVAASDRAPPGVSRPSRQRVAPAGAAP